MTKIAVLGTGMVGQTIAPKMVTLGHDVVMCTRDVEVTKSRSEPNPTTGVSFSAWYSSNEHIKIEEYGNVPDVDMYINASNGKGSIEALHAIGDDRLKNKIILDLANPLDFSHGMPPSMFVSNTDSLGEQIQREFPEAFVVKSLNTMNCSIMVDPGRISGDHSVFMSGNDSGSKASVKQLLESIGWKSSNIIDLGDITTARGTEMMLPVWIRLWDALGTTEFNFHIAKS